MVDVCSGIVESDSGPDDAGSCFPHIAVADAAASFVTVMLEAPAGVASSEHLRNTATGCVTCALRSSGSALGDVGQIDGLVHWLSGSDSL